MVVSAVTMFLSDVCGYMKSPTVCEAKIEIDVMVRTTW